MNDPTYKVMIQQLNAKRSRILRQIHKVEKMIRAEKRMSRAQESKKGNVENPHGN